MLRDARSSEAAVAPAPCPSANSNEHGLGIGRQLLMDIAAWSLSEQEVRAIFPSVSAARLKQYQVQLNRDQVRVVMLVLALDALAGSAETFSIRKLARVLDRPREESMQRTLRKWLLPLLAEAGWIEGFAATEDWSTSPHEISIAPDGISAMLRYFEKIRQAGGATS